MGGGLRSNAGFETTIYRIVEKSLSNVAKHAEASQVTILLTRKAAAVAALVEDDGRGFDPAGVGSGGLGLVGMHERVYLLGGRLQVESAADSAATLVAENPLA